MKHVPFFTNTTDDTRCFQAALRIVLKHFIPEQTYSFKKLDQMSAHTANMATWPTKGIIELHKMGFDVRVMEGFDPRAFIERGGEYLIEGYGKEMGGWAVQNTANMSEEQQRYSDYAKLGIHSQVLPELDDIRAYIDQGYLVICNLNSLALNNKKGYAGHFVVIFGYSPEGFTLHDPGLPPLKNREVAYEQFVRAWKYPSDASKNLMAFRLAERLETRNQGRPMGLL